MTVTPTLPISLLDRLLTLVETTLKEEGATHVWVDTDMPGLAIRADLPNLDA